MYTNLVGLKNYAVFMFGIIDNLICREIIIWAKLNKDVENVWTECTKQ